MTIHLQRDMEFLDKQLLLLSSMVEEGTAGRIRVSDAGTTKVQIEATANASSYINNGVFNGNRIFETERVEMIKSIPFP